MLRHLLLRVTHKQARRLLQLNLQREIHSRNKTAMELIAKGWNALLKLMESLILLHLQAHVSTFNSELLIFTVELLYYSVKKILDSYLASGLLAQFQGLPHVGNPNQYPLSSSRAQNSGRDDSCLKDESEMEEISECSQPSTAHACFQTDNNMENSYIPVHSQDDFRLAEEFGLVELETSSPSCS
ncbi:hypothetical protein MKW98_020410 [Papaver atlanticum]|uniref:Uncharacterized protein n=1 Tax=Papaver atlanticum TaxID=357466 RepID=A0AAD4RVL8_9MAGN|nr:hypothetical protein MKW98_020410 [Papaver atlanticum]